MRGGFAQREAIARWRRREERLARALSLPTIGVLALTAIVPMAWTAWESMHLHDLRMPWLGRPFVGLANYAEAFHDRRFLEAALHTVGFAAVSVTLEVAGGLALALALYRLGRGARVARTAVLLPWAIPTVVSALIWRFVFDSPDGLATQLTAAVGFSAPVWLSDPTAAWVPIVVADVWKTTPFVALLLLAGLQQIDPALYEAAALDGAGAWRQFRSVTLPLLRPTLAIAFLFRLLDAFRLFDGAYVLTNGGPGTATEPVALYAFTTLLQRLRFGYGSTLSIIVFAVSLTTALAAMRLLLRDTPPERDR